jgi:hypothetical protein
MSNTTRYGVLIDGRRVSSWCGVSRFSPPSRTSRWDAPSTRPLDTCLANPPNGGIMRQTKKPWVALGISRATWYRHGKPTEWHKLSTQAEEAKKGGQSLRSYQRFSRVFAPGKSRLVQAYVARGGMKLGLADYLLSHPDELRRFRAWHRRKR